MMECEEISKYSTNTFLKVLFSCQIVFAFSALVALVATSKRVFSSFLLDSAFKEHLFCCYIVHFIQAFSMLCSQSMMLFLHVTRPTCEATFSVTLCISLRIGTSFSIISLPTLNLALTLVRIVSYFSDYFPTRESHIRRLIMLLALLVIAAEQYWKYHALEIVEAQVAYCILNTKALLTKLNTEGMITMIFEVITLLMGFSLFALYHRRSKLTRSYDISVTLARRQIMETWQLFIPYSVLHAISFFGYQLLSSTYRMIFINLLDEVTFAAGSGFVFIPMYFVVIAPWLIFWIVYKRERGRIKDTNALINLEVKAKSLYFENYRNQWEVEEVKPHLRSVNGILDYLHKFRQKISSIP